MVFARSGFVGNATIITLYCDLIMSARKSCDPLSVGGGVIILGFDRWRCWGSAGTWWWGTRWSWYRGKWDNGVVAVVGQVSKWVVGGGWRFM